MIRVHADKFSSGDPLLENHITDLSKEGANARSLKKQQTITSRKGSDDDILKRPMRGLKRKRGDETEDNHGK